MNKNTLTVKNEDDSLKNNSIENLQMSRLWWKYLILFFGGLATFFGAVAVANYNFNPLMYSSSSNRKVASYLSQGLNYQIFDPNLDWRLLRREQISQMNKTPDVIVFGGSRWQEATSNLVKGKSFYNATIHNDYFEDMLAFSKILLDAKRLPKTLMLSIRFDTFTPIEKRSSDLWLTFLPEAQSMAKQLDIVTPSWKRFNSEYWTSLFSIEALKQQIEFRLNTSLRPGLTQNLMSEELDLIRSDGGLVWSEKHQKLFTFDSALNDAKNQFDKDKVKRLEFDPIAVAGLGKLIDFLHSQGVRVVLAQTPFYPTYYSSIIKTPYGKDLQRIEAEIYRLAKEHNALVAGSFDPQKVGCPASTYIDFNHAHEDCLLKVFEAIPGL